MSALPAASSGEAPPIGPRRDRSPAGALRWVLSIALVVAIHGSFLAMVRDVAPDAGHTAPEPILMDLAPMPAAPMPASELPAVAPPAVLAPADPAPPAAQPPMRADAPEPLPPAPEHGADAPPAPPNPSVAEAIPPPRPRHSDPRPDPRPVPRSAARATRSPAPPTRAEAAPTPSTTPAAPPGAAAPSAATPSATQAASAPPGQAMATWQSELLAHLARYKRFPVEAQRRGEQGVVVMRFVMDRGGHLISAVMARGSGYADLDAEAEAWLRRADPMPPLPPEAPSSRVELVVPLRFNLK